MDVSIIIYPIVQLFIAIIIGIVSAKTDYLSENVRTALSKVIVNITLPLMIITSLMSKELNGEVAINMAIVAICAVITVVVLFFIGLGTAKMFRLKEPTKTLHAILSESGNVAFLGYPIVLAVLGPEGMFYAVIYGMVNDAIFWSAGVYLMYRSSGNLKGKASAKKLLNANTIAFLIGVPLMLFKVKFPAILFDTLMGIGSMTTYLSMLFIGMTLARINIKTLYKRVSMIAPAIIKMVIAPLCVSVVLFLIGVEPIVAGAIVLEIAMPAQTSASIVAMDAGSDEQYAAEYIFFSTLLSLVTLPLVYYIMMKIFA